MKHPIEQRDEVARQAARYAAQVMTWAAVAFFGLFLLAVFGYRLIAGSLTSG